MGIQQILFSQLKVQCQLKKSIQTFCLGLLVGVYVKHLILQLIFWLIFSRCSCLFLGMYILLLLPNHCSPICKKNVYCQLFIEVCQRLHECGLHNIYNQHKNFYFFQHFHLKRCIVLNSLFEVLSNVCQYLIDIF